MRVYTDYSSIRYDGLLTPGPHYTSQELRDSDPQLWMGHENQEPEDGLQMLINFS